MQPIGDKGLLASTEVSLNFMHEQQSLLKFPSERVYPYTMCKQLPGIREL